MDEKLTKYLAEIRERLGESARYRYATRTTIELGLLEQLVRLQAALIDALRPLAMHDYPTKVEHADFEANRRALQAFVAEKLK